MGNLSLFSFIKMAKLKTVVEGRVEPIKKPQFKDPLRPAMWRYPVEVEPLDNEQESSERDAILAHLGFTYDTRGRYWWTRNRTTQELVSSSWPEAVAQYRAANPPQEPIQQPVAPTTQPASTDDIFDSDNPFGHDDPEITGDVELDLGGDETPSLFPAEGEQHKPEEDETLEEPTETNGDEDEDNNADEATDTGLVTNDVATKNNSSQLELPRPNPVASKKYGGYAVKPQFCGNSKIGKIKMMLVNEILGDHLDLRYQPNENKSWHTYDRDTYNRVVSDWDGVVNEFAPILRRKFDNIKKSFATESNIDIPVHEGMKYLPYQKAGIERMLELGNALLGDEQGLGKTIQVIGLAQIVKPTAMLVICPASVKQVWMDEWAKWDTTSIPCTSIENANLYDAMMKQGVMVVSFDLVSRNPKIFNKRVWDILVIDESHKLKNPEAKRTVAILGKWKKERNSFKEMIISSGIEAKRRLLLTGTPLPNRITELYPMLKVLDPDGLGADFDAFANTYAKRQGTRFHGSQNTRKLQELMRERFMIRRLKRDVLTDLPEKKRKIEFLQADDEVQKLLEDERKFYEDVDRAHLTKDSIPFQMLSKVRHLIGQHKVPQDIEFIRSILAQSPDQKVVVIAHHKDVIAAIKGALSEFHPVTVVGGDNLKRRNENIKAFQKDPATRICLGSIEAAGVGITLHAANVCIFVEFDWRPSAILQAEDRIHRIGQEKTCYIYFLMYDNSIDANMLMTAADKHVMQGEVLDKDTMDLSRYGQGLDLVGGETVQLKNGQEVNVAIDRATGMAFPEMPHRDRENVRALALSLLDITREVPDAVNKEGFSRMDGVTVKGMFHIPLSDWSDQDWWNLALIVHKYKKQTKYINQRRQEDLEECILNGKENSVDVDEYADSVAGVKNDY